ncbi:uncharacterized protein F5891DRAFT_745269 [Suillus fuscotomentosus]|uniref:Uncharacterized protein n=1 Tax=Suillus fuscotomentosus TaxID=1912939 RepID=A0AAD4HR55_9AGAM|nr:uncharacterized protein F5891DRAFT_745269 [Suillus fuscotomentosus]KAG1904499.1 hypothetical protein F5891DRAFT_745269 [Suillus fuscotomentosus]
MWTRPFLHLHHTVIHYKSDAIPRSVRRKPVIIPAMSPIPRPLPARYPHARLRFLRKLFSRTDAGRIDEPNPLDVCFFYLFASQLTPVNSQFPATSPLPRSLPIHDENSRCTPAPPNPPLSIIPQPSDQIDYQAGGVHRQLSLMFLSRRVDCGMLQRALPALMMS